ncbi:hypothetical protein PAXRUDRAFT_55038, partial [Paxillus rubicundulus Ve08.2h10]
LKILYYAVVVLKNVSGLTYTDQEGVRVMLQDKDIWDRYIKVNSSIYHISCIPFQNKGFVYFDKVRPLLPSHSKGEHI